jgi:hypothetical protein
MATALQHSPVSLLPVVYSTCHKLSIRTCKNTFYIRIVHLYTQHTTSDYGRVNSDWVVGSWSKIRTLFFSCHFERVGPLRLPTSPCFVNLDTTFSCWAISANPVLHRSSAYASSCYRYSRMSAYGLVKTFSLYTISYTDHNFPFLSFKRLPSLAPKSCSISHFTSTHTLKFDIKRVQTHKQPKAA